MTTFKDLLRPRRESVITALFVYAALVGAWWYSEYTACLRSVCSAPGWLFVAWPAVIFLPVPILVYLGLSYLLER